MLIYVVCLMARRLAGIDRDEITEFAPALVTATAMPPAFSIANGSRSGSRL